MRTASITLSHDRARGALRPEFEFLLACGALWQPLPHEIGDQFADFDWDFLRRAATANGLMPHVFQALSASRVCNQVPKEIWTAIRDSFQDNLARNFWLVEELLAVTRTLRAAGIACIPYKGPAMAAELWGNVALRRCADLDVLVRRSDVAFAREVLSQSGLEPDPSVPERLAADHLRTAAELQFRKPSVGLLVELQWNAVPRCFCADIDIEQAWSQAVQCRFAGEEILRLADEDLLLALAVHGWKHHWSKLIWVGDIAQLCRRKLDWERVFERAASNGLRRILLLALFLANRLFEIALPSGILDAIDSDQSIAALATQSIDVMQNMENLGYFGRHRYLVGARERAADRTRYVLRFLTTPGIGEWNAVSLPPRLNALYRLVRVARVAAMAFGKTRE